jgi:hypothetical protein
VNTNNESQNNSQALNASEEKPMQQDSPKPDSQASEPQAGVVIDQKGLHVEITLPWKQVRGVLQSAKRLLPYITTIGLTTVGTNPRLLQLFYPTPASPPPIHQIDSQRS